MSARSLQATSKAYKTTLPGSLLESDLQELQRWVHQNCSSSAIWRSNGEVIWIAPRERVHTQEALIRHLHDVIAVLCLLMLLTEEEVKQAVNENHDTPTSWSAPLCFFFCYERPGAFFLRGASLTFHERPRHRRSM